MSTLLFEIGTEELPSSAVASGEAQLRAGAERLLSEARISFEAVDVFATPRRLAVVVRGVPEQQAPSVDERRGPPVAKSLMEDGSFSPAAVGFARANDVAPEDLVRKETDSGEYMFAVVSHPGKTTAEVLPHVLGELAGSLSFPKTMRWDASGVRFPRPVRWIVALFGDEVVPVTFGQLQASRTSYGHRVFHPGAVEFATADDYAEGLRKAGVVADRDGRRDAVRSAVEEAAGQLGGRAILHDRVVEEVTDLVETPTAVTGTFDRTFLEVPRDVVITAMESHQRYFPVAGADGELEPGFVVVSNGDPANARIIATGNERVLRARLEDARFFYREDLKRSLTDRAEQLSDLVLHARLGTMRDKVIRVGSLLADVARWCGLDEDDTSAAYYAADIYKADLLTHLVYEFPELQGAVGREYALRDRDLQKEAGDLLPRVADAIGEQYLPRSPGDDLPRTPAGVALGLADRLDTLVGYVGIGEAPSGSEDPFALRRTATGFVQIVIDRDARIPIDEAVGRAYESYRRGGVELEDPGALAGHVREILVARTEGLLEREGIDRTLVKAAVRSAYSDLPDLAVRARALQQVKDAGTLHPLAVAHERAWNLSRSGPHGDVDESLLGHPAEENLYQQLVAVEEVAAELAAQRRYDSVLETLLPLSEVVDVFFDRDRGVLVMDPDENIRRNRLALLERIARVFTLVADFSGVHPAELESPQTTTDEQ